MAIPFQAVITRSHPLKPYNVARSVIIQWMSMGVAINSHHSAPLDMAINNYMIENLGFEFSTAVQSFYFASLARSVDYWPSCAASSVETNE